MAVTKITNGLSYHRPRADFQLIRRDPQYQPANITNFAITRGLHTGRLDSAGAETKNFAVATLQIFFKENRIPIGFITSNSNWIHFIQDFISTILGDPEHWAVGRLLLLAVQWRTIQPAHFPGLCTRRNPTRIVANKYWRIYSERMSHTLWPLRFAFTPFIHSAGFRPPP